MIHRWLIAVYSFSVSLFEMPSETFSTLLGQATKLILNLRRAAAWEVADTFDMRTTSGIRPKSAKGPIFAQSSSSDTIQGSSVADIIAESPA